MINKSIDENTAKLDQKMQEITHVQKRLLTRYKEKNPTAMNNLDILFFQIYEEIIEMANEIQKLQDSRKQNGHQVSLALQLVLFLIKLRFNLTDEKFNILKNYISNDINGDSEEFNWIDITDVNILYLIKSVLLKQDSTANAVYKKVDNLETFQNHFTLLIDKISKGALDNVKIDDDK